MTVEHAKLYLPPQEAINRFERAYSAWNYYAFCSHLGLVPDSYAETKWGHFVSAAQSLAHLGDPAGKIIEEA